jgi:hypothetical protein
MRDKQGMLSILSSAMPEAVAIPTAPLRISHTSNDDDLKNGCGGLVCLMVSHQQVEPADEAPPPSRRGVHPRERGENKPSPPLS